MESSKGSKSSSNISQHGLPPRDRSHKVSARADNVTNLNNLRRVLQADSSGSSNAVEPSNKSSSKPDSSSSSSSEDVAPPDKPKGGDNVDSTKPTRQTLQLIKPPPDKQFDVDHALDETKGLRDASESIAKASKVTAAQVTRDVLVQQYGVDQARFDEFCQQTGSVFSPSASAGHHLAETNDHAGVLIVSVPHRGVSIAERLVVVTDVMPNGELRYLVKGYENRIVSFENLALQIDDLRLLEGQRNETAERRAENLRLYDDPEPFKQLDVDQADSPDPLETEFRSRMRELSELSELLVRRNLKESDTATFVPVIKPVLKVASERWENTEDAMPLGFGKTADSAGSHLVDYQFHFDWNKVEGRILLFRNDHFEGRLQRPPKEGDRHPTVKAAGPVLAQIDGVKHIEVMGHPLEQYGVKMARWSPANMLARLKGSDGTVTLRITTKDNAVHELTLSDTGAKMRLINPQPRAGYSTSGAAFGVGDAVQADFDVYSYRGWDTGVHGSSSGYADPQLLTSFGDSIPPGPFLRPAGGARGGFLGMGLSVANMVTLQPLQSSGSRSTTFSLISNGIRLGLQGALVGAFTAVANAIRRDDGTILGGGKAFSASGAGKLTAEMQAGLVLATATAQETFTKLLGFAASKMPEGWKFERDPWKTIASIFGASTAEFLRLAMNLGIQKGIGVPRGNPVDWIAITVQSVLNSIVEWAREGATGKPENHRYLQVMLDVVKWGVDMGSRSLGNVGELNWKQFKEAIVTRSITRADKLLSGALAHMLDANGVIGPHASAYESQVAYAARHANALTWLYGLDERLSVAANEKEEHAAEFLEQLGVVRQVIGCLEGVKAGLNRRTLAASGKDNADKSHVSRAHDLLVGEERAFYGAAGADQRLKEYQRDYFQVLQTDPTKLHVFDSTSLSGDVRKEAEELQRTPQHLLAPNYPTLVTYDGRTIKSMESTPGSVQPVRRDLTTFSEKAQKKARPVHEEMLRCPGMIDIDKGKLPKLPPRMIAKIQKSTRDYTVESQLFHYPLRYGYTGQKRQISVVPGIKYEYNVMHSGTGEGFVDPIEALYVNLGALHAPKLPCVGYRAVVTDAAYVVGSSKQAPGKDLKQAPDKDLEQAPDEDSRAILDAESEMEVNVEPSAQAKPKKDDEPKVLDPKAYRVPAYLVHADDYVGNTEIFSITASQDLSTAFGWSLGYGAAGRDRTQALVVLQDTGVNITHLTDLVQGEIIQTPGAVYQVVNVQRSESGSGQNIGQRVFLKQVDTYLWEEAGEQGGFWLDEEDQLSVAEIELTTADSARKSKAVDIKEPKDDKGKEPDIKARQDDKGKEPDIKAPKDVKKTGGTPSMGRGGHIFMRYKNSETKEFASIKSYFVGSNMERPIGTEGDQKNVPSAQRSRFMYPYTSDFAPRATKDAIHAAILAGPQHEPIVEFLDDAIKNPHHEYYRERGGYENSELERKHKEEVDQVKGLAKKLMAPIQELKMGSDLSPDHTEWMAWLLSSMLRTPIALVEIDEDGLGGAKVPDNAQVRVFDKTYDLVDITKKIDKSPNPPVTIGVGKDGFYVIESHNGQQLCRPMGYGRAVSNFLHAYYRASPFSEEQAYEGTGGLKTSKQSRETVAALMAKLQDFSATDYIVLQAAIVKAARTRAKTDDLKALDVKIDFARLLAEYAFEPDFDRAAHAYKQVKVLSGEDSERSAIAETAARPALAVPVGRQATKQQKKAAVAAEEKELNTMREHSMLLQDQLYKNRLQIVENSGDSLNCLILSILQGVTGLDDGHKEAAAAIRNALIAEYPEVEGKMLYSDDEPARYLVRRIGELAGLPDLRINVFSPGPQGLDPFALSGDGDPSIALLFGRDGARHYELITTRRGVQ